GVRGDLLDPRLDEGDAERREALPGRGVDVEAVGREDDDVLAQGAEHERLVEGGGPGGDHTDGLVAHLPAVAEGAVHEVRAPVRGQARDLGQLVADARGDQQSAGGEGAAIGEGEGEAQVPVGRRLGGAGGGDLAGDDQAAVLAHLGPAAGEV